MMVPEHVRSVTKLSTCQDRPPVMLVRTVLLLCCTGIMMFSMSESEAMVKKESGRSPL
jgi:hypothetical protein